MYAIISKNKSGHQKALIVCDGIQEYVMCPNVSDEVWKVGHDIMSKSVHIIKWHKKKKLLTHKSMSWPHTVWKVRHDVKIYIMTSKTLKITFLT